jgi:hypothetical protein
VAIIPVPHAATHASCARAAQIPRTRALVCTEWGTPCPNFSANLLDLQKFSADMFEQQKNSVMIEGFADCDGHWIQSRLQKAGFKKFKIF